jgi:hypothetical protein
MYAPAQPKRAHPWWVGWLPWASQVGVSPPPAWYQQ